MLLIENILREKGAQRELWAAWGKGSIPVTAAIAGLSGNADKGPQQICDQPEPYQADDANKLPSMAAPRQYQQRICPDIKKFGRCLDTSSAHRTAYDHTEARAMAAYHQSQQAKAPPQSGYDCGC